MSEQPLKQRTIRGAVWTALGGNSAQALSFVAFVLISRVVGPEAFGVIAICLLLVELARAFASECVIVNLLARGRYAKDSFDAGFIIGASASLLVAIALTAASPLLALAFRIDSLAQVLPLMAPLLAVHALSRMFETELMLRMEFRALAFRSVVAVIVGGAVGIAMAYGGHGVTALILQQWVSALIALVLLAAQARWRPGLAFSRASFVALARQSAAIAPAGIVTNLRHTLDGLAVAGFSGAAAAGLYNLAKRTRLALQLGVTAAIGRVSLPALGSLKDDPERLASAAHQTMRLGAVVAFPIFIGVAAIAPELIALFLGTAWSGAAAPMMFLLIASALTTNTGVSEILLLVKERRSLIVAIHGFALAVFVSAVIFVAPYGPAAVAAAVMTACILQNIAAWSVARRFVRLPVRAYLANVWAPMAISLAMLGVIAAMRAFGIGDHLPLALKLAAYVSAGALFYFAAAWVCARPAVLATIDAARLVLRRAPAEP